MSVGYVHVHVETEEGFVKVRSQKPVMIDQTVRRDVDLDDVVQPSVMITRFTQLKHFVKVIILHDYLCSAFITFALA